MALKGEGDPRWVVRERVDGTNVNKWHWEEKKVTTWAHQRIRTLLNVSEISVPNALIEEIDAIDGDAMLYNRKGVLKVLYDLKITGKWRSNHDDEDERTHGTFRFELFDDDPEVVVVMDSQSRCEIVYKNAVATALQPAVLKASRTFIAELRAGAGQVLDGVSVAAPKKKVTETKVTDFLRSGMDQPVRKEPEKQDTSITTLDLRDRFNCSKIDLFRVLTERPQLEAITRAKCKSDAADGGEFALMNGTVIGKYIKLVPGEKIEMLWKMKTWKMDGDGARVTVTIEQDENLCSLRVQLNGVPNKYKTETEGFWRVQIFQATKVIMGYGSGAAGFF